MLTRAIIEYNFRLAKAQASQLDDVAKNLSEMAQKQLGNTLQSLASGWKGENATQYLNKGSALQRKINTSAKALQNVAADIRVCAQRTYNAEMRALEIALRRKRRH